MHVRSSLDKVNELNALSVNLDHRGEENMNRQHSKHPTDSKNGRQLKLC